VGGEASTAGTTSGAAVGGSADSAQAGTSAASVVETPATPDANESPIGFSQALRLRADDSGGTTVALLGLALALMASTKIVGRRLVRP